MDRLTQSRLMHYLRSRRPVEDWPDATPDVVHAVYRQGRSIRKTASQLGMRQIQVREICDKLKHVDRADPDWYRILAREEADFAKVVDEIEREYGERDFRNIMRQAANAWLDGATDPRRIARRAGVPLLVALDLVCFFEWASFRGQVEQEDEDGDGGIGVFAPLHPPPFRPRGPHHGIPYGDKRERPVSGNTTVGQTLPIL